MHVRKQVLKVLLLGLVLLLFAAREASAQVHRLWYRAVPAVGSPVEQTLRSDTTLFTFNTRTPGDFQVTISDPQGTTLRIAPPAAEGFNLGAEEVVHPYLFRGNSAGIDFSPAPCNLSYARYVVLEMAFTVELGAVKLSTFAVDFEKRCTDGSRYFGELRFNSTAPLTSEKPAGSKTPDAFAFPARTDAIPGALVFSDTTTIYGTNAAAPISIVGGQYSINGAAYTSLDGVAAPGDRISVLAVASGQLSKTTTATLTVGGVAGAFNVTTFTPAAPFTAITMQNGAVPSLLDARLPEWSITATQPQPGTVNVQALGPAGQSLGLVFRAPVGQTLRPGPYEETTPNGVPGLQVISSSACLTPLTGRFVIHDIAIGPSGVVQRLAASFEQWCVENVPPIFGEVRLNSGFPLPSMVLEPDSTPYPFALRAQSPVRAGSLVRSNIVTIDGVNQPVPISIVGGTYSLNGGPFTSAPGTAHLHDDIVVQLEASRIEGGVRSAVFTAGGFSATLSAQTYRSGMALSGLWYQSDPDDRIGQGRTRFYLAPPAAIALAAAPTNAVAPQVITMQGDVWELRFSTPGTTFLTGPFSNVVRYGLETPGVAGMHMFLDAQPGNPERSCAQVSGNFNVREVSYLLGGVDRLAVDLVQHCDGAAPALAAEVRLNSTVPFTALVGNTCTAADPSCVADVSITQATSGNATIGNDLVITLTVANNGPAVAHNVAVTDSLPPNATLRNAPDGCAVVDATVRCLMEALAPGGIATFNVVVRPTQAGAITNLATVTAEEIDPTPGNNGMSLTIAVTGTARVVNLSTRAQMLGGSDVVIAGFVIGAGAPKTVVISAVGPSLAAAGIPDFLANPTLTLVRSSDGAVIATNDDWGSAPNAAQVAASGFAPGNPLEPAIMVTLPPGAYTAIVSSATDTIGMTVVAVYEVNPTDAPLVNISTRGEVLPGDNVMIGGFVIQGSLPRTVVVTGIGPALFGVDIINALPDPTLTLVRSSDGAVLATNDDWGSAPNAAAISASGFAPTDARESAIMMTLPPGAYTVILAGAGGLSGIGIVAVNSVQ